MILETRCVYRYDMINFLASPRGPLDQKETRFEVRDWILQERLFISQLDRYSLCRHDSISSNRGHVNWTQNSIHIADTFCSLK